MNLETRAAVNTLPLNLSPEGAGDGRFYRTASGGFICGGAWQFQGNDEHGLLRSLNGRLIGVHKKCCAALQKSRAKDDKTYSWNMTVVARFRFKAKFVME